jgi:hypothetical protein
MVRLFDKLKASLAPLNKLRATRQSNPPTTRARSDPLSDTSESPDPPVTSLATTSPEPVFDTKISQNQPETLCTSSSPPVITKRASVVKISRIKRVSNRPQPIIQENGTNDIDDDDNAKSRRVHIVSRKPMSLKLSAKAEIAYCHAKVS